MNQEQQIGGPRQGDTYLMFAARWFKSECEAEAGHAGSGSGWLAGGKQRGGGIRSRRAFSHPQHDTSILRMKFITYTVVFTK